jgi:hypothetical protein
MEPDTMCNALTCDDAAHVEEKKETTSTTNCPYYCFFHTAIGYSPSFCLTEVSGNPDGFC